MNMSPQERMQAARNDEHMFVISGTVSTMYITDGTVNLLEGMQGRVAAAGAGSALAGISGSVANAAIVAMDDGEHVQHFGCYLGDQMVIGTFPDLSFQEGDAVSAVVTRLDDHVAFAHAIVRTSDFKLWMPYSVDKGRYAIALWLAKLTIWIVSFSVLFESIFFASHQSIGSFFKEIGTFAVGMTCMMFILGYLTYRSSPEGPYAERILKVLGFKNPKSVNLAPYSEYNLMQAAGRQGGSMHVYDLIAARRAYDLPMRSTRNSSNNA